MGRGISGRTWGLQILMLAGVAVFSSNLRAEQGLPMDPALFPDDTCKNCHESSTLPKTDVTAPECRECHTPVEFMADEEAAYEPVPALSKTQGPSINEMIEIPAGEFLIGNNGRGVSEGRGDPDEMPLHRFYVQAFLMDVFEVTNQQFQEFVDANVHRTPVHWKTKRPPGHPGSPMTYPEGKGDHPVIYVDWFDAVSYCRWVGKRLPTEEEWEKAARGTDGRIFPWGNDFDIEKANTPQRWLSKNSDGDTMPIGHFENGKSPYGLYDMAGNVYEWTSSWYKPYPENHEFNGHYGYKNKIVRGGSWYDCLTYGCGLSAPTYNRSRFSPEIRNKGFGFRCAKSLHVN
ncbi:MAG TPA: formylglycine-generating enzyme family protein [Nitrospiria bacterium]